MANDQVTSTSTSPHINFIVTAGEMKQRNHSCAKLRLFYALPSTPKRSNMITGNMLSAFPKSPSVQSMMLSAVPEGLQRLAECSERLPHTYFTVDELDAIVDGKDTEELESSLADGIYLQSVLPAVDWWLDVAKDVAGGNGMEHDLWTPAYEVQKHNLLALLNGVLSSYAAAFAEAGISFSVSDRIPAGMEMLKRYRLFTRYVCSFAQEVWPEVELGWLRKQA